MCIYALYKILNRVQKYEKILIYESIFEKKCKKNIFCYLFCAILGIFGCREYIIENSLRAENRLREENKRKRYFRKKHKKIASA